MSILNVLLNNDRLLVAVDTLAEDAYTGRHSAGAKLLLIPQHNLVLASRGSAQFFPKIYELCLQASFLADFTIEGLAAEIGPTMDRLWPGYVEAAEAAALPVHHLRTEIVLGGWSGRLGRMTATAYAKHASETPALIQPLIGGLASPGEPLRGRPDSFDPVEVFQAGVLQATYLNDKNGRQVAGGALLVAHLRQREARINEWPFVQPGLVRKERTAAGEPATG
ncbi:hypothetical protein [Stenotrophomonas sp.]|uniref:hypothetical protein n=1 Tax=Stenotrophomonas sp. TaxID=69392 RepID=UPI0028A6245B|nr:hypothetical protein [Stenotrophomonas sp.]